jgi:hypothetical protein
VTEIFLRCRDSSASAETIRLECKLRGSGYVDFDDAAWGIATWEGANFEFDLDDHGRMCFGKEGGDDPFWRTDFHDLEMKLGKVISVRTAFGPSLTYEIVRIR